MLPAIGISVTESYINGALTLIHSIKKHNNFHFRLFVVNIDLSDESVFLLSELHRDIEFIEVPLKEDYLSKIKHTEFDEHSDKLCIVDGFYRFELLTAPTDNLVYMDCDMLCIGSIEELWDIKADFSACYVESPHIITGSLEEVGEPYHFNSGLFIANEKYLNEQTKDKLKSLINSFTPPNDEQVLNYYFTSVEKSVNFLPSKYNTPIGWAIQLGEIPPETSILHYGPQFRFPKPWEEKDYPFKELWQQHFSEYKSAVKQPPSA